MSKRGQSRIKTTISTAALLAAASYSYAQQSDPPGLELTIDVGTGVSVNDNLSLSDPSAGTTISSDTRLRFGLNSETRVSRLNLGVSGNLSFRDGPGDNGTFEISTPVASLSYFREGANSFLELSGTFSRERLDETFLTFLDENLNPVDLAVSGGELQRLTAGVRFATGVSAPLGFELRANLDDRDYIDTGFDPDLFDRTVVGLSGTARLRFSDVMTGQLFANTVMYDADDLAQTERTTNEFGAGLEYQVSRTLGLSARVAYTTIEEKEFGFTTEDIDGLAWSFGGVQEVSDGSYSASIAHTISEAAERTQIRVDRRMDLPRGSLGYGIGYSMSDGGDDTFLLRIAASREFEDATLGASVSQETISNDDGDDLLLSRIAVNYRQEINSTSDLSLNFGLGRTEDIGSGSEPTTTRADFDVTYSRELTRDWDWSLGYRARYRNENGGDTAHSNEIFTRIDRSFSIRP